MALRRPQVGVVPVCSVSRQRFEPAQAPASGLDLGLMRVGGWSQADSWTGPVQQIVTGCRSGVGVQISH
jgi:hypothetical protein